MHNNRIRAPQVRVINETGEQLGVMDLTKALRISRERGLDLIQVTDKVTPPVCKIIDYGKYQYQQGKKKKLAKKKTEGKLKAIRIGFNISLHDLEIKARLAEKFLKKKNKVMIEMRLKGREKALQGFAKEKIDHFLKVLGESVPMNIERELKRQPKGLTIIISDDIKRQK